MNGYGSHIPVMESFLPILGHDIALEFGCGDFSTEWLCNHFDRVFSVEVDQNWVNKMPAREGWLPYVPEDRDERNFFFDVPIQRYDLILVDGGECVMRKHILQVCLSLALAPLILAHDSERPEYEYDRVFVPDTYSLQNIGLMKPSTFVYSSKLYVSNHLGVYQSDT